MGRKNDGTDSFENYLPPEIVRQLEFSTLEISKDSFVDEELKAHHTDILYQISTLDERPLSIYCLFEHKSYLSTQIVLQLLRYMLKIWEHQIKQDQQLRKQRKNHVAKQQNIILLSRSWFITASQSGTSPPLFVTSLRCPKSSRALCRTMTICYSTSQI